MYKAFIEPDLAKAHLRISNTFNPFSGFMDATYILKSAKHVTVQDVRAAVPVGAQPTQVTPAQSRPCACRQPARTCFCRGSGQITGLSHAVLTTAAARTRGVAECAAAQQLWLFRIFKSP